MNVERVNGLIYAVVMDSRGVYMSTDMKTSKIYADGIPKFNKQIAKVVVDWKKSVRGDDAELFVQFSQRIAQFIDFRRELARLGTEVSPAAGREWGDNEPTVWCARRSTKIWRCSPRFIPSAPRASTRKSIPASTRPPCG
ncbi:MAG TPA: hypothetical protein VLN61_01410 [Pseudolabrys sp.]|nr:hypothetical protein [Pseudolabrys sp.]